MKSIIRLNLTLSMLILTTTFCMAENTAKCHPLDFFEVFQRAYPQYNVTPLDYDFSRVTEEAALRFPEYSADQIITRLLTLSGNPLIEGVDLCSHKNITVRDHASKVFAEIVKDRLKKRKTIRTDLLYIMVMCSPNMDDVMTVVHAFGQKKDFPKLTTLFIDSVDPSNRQAIFSEIQKAYKDLEQYPEHLAFYREDILMMAKTILKFSKAGIEALDWAEGVQKKLNDTSYSLFSSAYTGH